VDHTGIGNNFMNRTPIVQQLRESIEKWNHMKPTNFQQGKHNGEGLISFLNDARKTGFPYVKE
jgi:hypothetical protein